MYMYGCFELAGLFDPPTAIGSKTMPVLSTVEARSHNTRAISRKQPQKHGNGKKPAANYEQAKVRNCAGVTVVCVP